MVTLDQGNTIFVIGAIFVVLKNIHLTYKQKSVKGVSILSTFWFFSWAFFNCFFYSGLEQKLSFVLGIFLTLVQLTWLSLMIFYSRKERCATKKN